MALHFVVDGAISVDGAEVCQKHDGCHFEVDEEMRLTALADTVLLVYGMPKFP